MSRQLSNACIGPQTFLQSRHPMPALLRCCVLVLGMRLSLESGPCCGACNKRSHICMYWRMVDISTADGLVRVFMLHGRFLTSAMWISYGIYFYRVARLATTARSCTGTNKIFSNVTRAARTWFSKTCKQVAKIFVSLTPPGDPNGIDIMPGLSSVNLKAKRHLTAMANRTYSIDPMRGGICDLPHCVFGMCDVASPSHDLPRRPRMRLSLCRSPVAEGFQYVDGTLQVMDLIQLR